METEVGEVNARLISTLLTIWNNCALIWTWSRIGKVLTVFAIFIKNSTIGSLWMLLSCSFFDKYSWRTLAAVGCCGVTNFDFLPTVRDDNNDGVGCDSCVSLDSFTVSLFKLFRLRYISSSSSSPLLSLPIGGDRSKSLFLVIQIRSEESELFIVFGRLQFWCCFAAFGFAQIQSLPMVVSSSGPSLLACITCNALQWINIFRLWSRRLTMCWFYDVFVLYSVRSGECINFTIQNQFWLLV